MFPATAERVTVNTAETINERIRRKTRANVERYGSAGPAAIAHRLQELDQEWDIERCVETLAPTLSLIGMGLGLTTDRRWFLLPIVVQAFFLQHALQGWCPPVPLLRRLGVRTAAEIDEERNALKALRGDYQNVNIHSPAGWTAQQALQAAQA